MSIYFKRKLSLILVLIFAAVAFIMPAQVNAFQAASHYVLVMDVASNLPEDSLIRQAIFEHPKVAALGAFGPDLGYLNARSYFGYSPWADTYHYDSVGTYAKRQLEKAIESGDLKKIAFAAGWVTHIAGDLACHGIFVNPETGVYMENEETRDLHKELEKTADKYIWCYMSELPWGDYGPSVDLTSGHLSSYFASAGDLPVDLIQETSAEVLGKSSSREHMREWVSDLHTVMDAPVIGYSYKTHEEAMEVLSQGNRIERLELAYAVAFQRSIELLTAAENGDYSGFTDRWNLDAAEDDRPIGSLSVKVGTADQAWAGTDDDVYFGMKLSNGKIKEWKLDTPAYNDFERGDIDDYYLYVGDMDFHPQNITKVWLKKVKKGLFSDDWKVNFVQIKVNGELKLNTQLNREFTSSNNRWETNVSWTPTGNNTPASISFTASGQSSGSSQVKYVVNGEPTTENIGDFHIIVNDPDTSVNSDKITSVEIKRVNADQSETVVKTINTANHRVELSQDIYALMNPNYPDPGYFNMSQTFKVVAYQTPGMPALVSGTILVNIVQNYAPHFTIYPFGIEPVVSDPYSQYGDYPVPTSLYWCPYQLGEITDQTKIPKFYVRAFDFDAYDSDKITKLELIKLGADYTHVDTVVAEYNFPTNQQYTDVVVEIPATQCMGEDISARFAVRVTNRAGYIYTSNSVGAIWNVIDTAPWIRFGVGDVPSAARYEGQTLSYSGSRDVVKNANPKFHIEIEGSQIVDTIHIVDFYDNPIWTKDISILKATSYVEDVNLLPIIQAYNNYRVKAIGENGQVYYSQRIKTNWLSWSMGGGLTPILVNGYPWGMDNVTVYSDQEPSFVIGYTWAGTTQTEVSKINIKASSGETVHTINIDGKVNATYNVPIAGLMGTNNTRTFYAEYVYKNVTGSYKSGNTTINLVRKNDPVITFKPFGVNPVNGSATYTSNFLPNQLEAAARPKFNILIVDPDTDYRDQIQRVELLNGSGQVVKSLDVSSQNASTMTLDWDSLECLSGSLNGTFRVRIINKDCKEYYSQLIQATWNCTNNFDAGFNVDQGADADGYISLADSANPGSLTFNINVYEADALPGFGISKIELMNESGAVEKILTSSDWDNGSNTAWAISTEINVTEVMQHHKKNSFRLRVTNESGQVYTVPNEVKIKRGKPTVNFYPFLQLNAPNPYTFTSALLPSHYGSGQLPGTAVVVEDDGYGIGYIEVWTTYGQRIRATAVNTSPNAFYQINFDSRILMGNRPELSLYVKAYQGTYNGSTEGMRCFTYEPYTIIWNLTNTADISFKANGQGVGSSLTFIGAAEDMPQAERPRFHININEPDAYEEFNITKVDIVNANGQVVKTLSFNGRSIDAYVNIDECMAVGNTESFNLIVRNAAGQVFTTGSITVNWINNQRSVVRFYDIQNPTKAHFYYLGNPEEQQEGRPLLHISVYDPDVIGDEIVTKVEVMRKSDNRVMKSYDVAAQNSRSFDADIDVYSLVGWSSGDGFYVKVTYSGRPQINSRDIYISWNHYPDVYVVYDGGDYAEEITVVSQYTPQEAQVLGIGPEFELIVDVLDTFYENIIQKIEFVTATGEVLLEREYNSDTYTLNDSFSVAKALSGELHREFKVRITYMIDDRVYKAPLLLKVNWIVEEQP